MWKNKLEGHLRRMFAFSSVFLFMQSGMRLPSSARRCLSTPSLSKMGKVLGGERIESSSMETFTMWHESLEKVIADPNSSEATMKNFHKHVHPEVMFHPPTYITPWKGRDEFLLLMTCVSEVFGSSF